MVDAKVVLSKALEINTTCVDCGEKKPTWVSLVKVNDSVTLSAFCCYSCASQHRSLGTHITRVKSCTLNEWSQQEIDWVSNTGSNLTVNAILEGSGGTKVEQNKPIPMSDSTSRKSFVHMKYARQDYFNQLALQEFLMKGSSAFMSSGSGGAGGGGSSSFATTTTAGSTLSGGGQNISNNNNAFDDDDDDLFDDSKTTTTELFGHCTKTGRNKPINPFMQGVMEEGSEEEDDEDNGGGGNSNNFFSPFDSTEPAPFEPFGGSTFDTNPKKPESFTDLLKPKKPESFSDLAGSRHSNASKNDSFLTSPKKSGGGGGGRSSGSGGGGPPSLDDAFGKFTPLSPVPANHMSSGGSVTPSVTGNPDITNAKIQRLESEKRQAVANEDYVRAAELKHQIELERLEEEKRQAVAAEDYIRAAELKKEIDNFLSKSLGKSGRGGGRKDKGSGLNSHFAKDDGGGEGRRHRDHDEKSINSNASGRERKSHRPPRSGRRGDGPSRSSKQQHHSSDGDDEGLRSMLDGSVRSRGSTHPPPADGFGSPTGSVKSKMSVQSAPPDAWTNEKDNSSPPGKAAKSSRSLFNSSSAPRSGRDHRRSSRSSGSGSGRPSRRQHSTTSSDDDDDILFRGGDNDDDANNNRRRSSSNRHSIERSSSNPSLSEEGGGGDNSRTTRRGTTKTDRLSSSRDDDRGRRSGSGEKDDRHRRRSKSAARQRRRPARRTGDPDRSSSKTGGGGGSSNRGGDDYDDYDDDGGDNNNRRRGGGDDSRRSGVRKTEQLEAF